MNEYRLLVLTLALLFICAGQAYSGEQDTAATVGDGYIITFRALQERVHERYYDRVYHLQPPVVAYLKALEDMVVDQLKRIDFNELGLEKDSTLLQSNRRMINEELVIKYFEREYVQKYLNDKSIREAYEHMKREVVCRRLRVDTLALHQTPSGKFLKDIAGKLESDRARGKSFDDLITACRRLLKSPSAKLTTESVTWKQSLANDSDEIIFNLSPGDVRILLSPTELQIVELLNVKKVAVEPFEKVRDDIYNALKQRQVDRGYEEFSLTKAALVDEHGLRWNQKGLQKLLDWSNTPTFYGGMYADTLSKAIAEGRNLVLLNYRGGKVDLQEYLRLLNDVLILPPRGQYRIADLKGYILEALRTDRIVKKAVAQGLAKTVLNARTTDPVLKDRIVSLYNQKQIDSKIPQLTEGRIREFYAANKDTLYYQLAKVNIYAIIFSDKRGIDSLWQMHLRGAPFEKLSRNYFVKAFIKDRDDDTIRSYRSMEKPFLAKAAFSLILNQVAGPIEYNDPEQGMQYAIIKCVELRPEKQLTLDEARETISDDFKEYEKKRLGSETVERLKTKYGFRIYDDVVRRNIPPTMN